jgi:hypothetical protein
MYRTMIDGKRRLITKDDKEMDDELEIRRGCE